MRKMTIGMLVIGLLLVCSQAFGEGEEAKTLTEWGLPAVSQWVLWVNDFQDNRGTICKVYKAPAPFYLIFAYRYPNEVKWFKISTTVDEVIFDYYDNDYDGLWTRGKLRGWEMK